LFRRFGAAHTLHLVRAVFGLPLTYVQNPEGDALDDDEAGRGVHCENGAGIVGRMRACDKRDLL